MKSAITDRESIETQGGFGNLFVSSFTPSEVYFRAVVGIPELNSIIIENGHSD